MTSLPRFRKGRSTEAFFDGAPPQAQDREVQVQVQVPDETKDCLPFESVRSSTVNHANSDEVCQSHSDDCPVCCRVFEWLVCDRDNVLTHLQCVCNSFTRTASPTIAPSGSVSPSSAPSDTWTPSFEPSSSPSTSDPSESPTSSPSPAPSPAPTFDPTMFPSIVTSEQPTPSPTLESSAETASDTPTAFPEIQLTPAQYVTDSTEDEFGNWVRSTSCVVPPENTQAIVRANYTFQYQLYVNEAVDPWQALISNHLHEKIHDVVVEEFFQCTFQEDNLWMYVSLPHAIDTALNCTGSTPVSKRCFVASAVETIWVYDAPERRGRQLQDSVASEFVAEINSFISDSMAKGSITGNGEITSLMYAGFSAVASNMEPNPLPMPTGNPTSTPSDGGDGEIPQQEFPQLTNKDAEGAADNGLSAAGITILSILGALSAIIALLVVKRRRGMGQRIYEKENADFVNAAGTAMEENAEHDSMPDTIPGADSFLLLDEVYDPYTSASPPRRSRRAPLYSQDELDMAIKDRVTSCEASEPSKAKRKGIATDTVDL